MHCPRPKPLVKTRQVTPRLIALAALLAAAAAGAAALTHHGYGPATQPTVPGAQLPPATGPAELRAHVAAKASVKVYSNGRLVYEDPGDPLTPVFAALLAKRVLEFYGVHGPDVTPEDYLAVAACAAGGRPSCTPATWETLNWQPSHEDVLLAAALDAIALNDTGAVVPLVNYTFQSAGNSSAAVVVAASPEPGYISRVCMINQSSELIAYLEPLQGHQHVKVVLDSFPVPPGPITSAVDPQVFNGQGKTVGLIVAPAVNITVEAVNTSYQWPPGVLNGTVKVTITAVAYASSQVDVQSIYLVVDSGAVAYAARLDPYGGGLLPPSELGVDPSALLSSLRLIQPGLGTREYINVSFASLTYIYPQETGYRLNMTLIYAYTNLTTPITVSGQVEVTYTINLFFSLPLAYAILEGLNTTLQPIIPPGADASGVLEELAETLFLPPRLARGDPCNTTRRAIGYLTETNYPPGWVVDYSRIAWYNVYNATLAPPLVPNIEWYSSLPGTVMRLHPWLLYRAFTVYNCGLAYPRQFTDIYYVDLSRYNSYALFEPHPVCVSTDPARAASAILATLNQSHALYTVTYNLSTTGTGARLTATLAWNLAYLAAWRPGDLIAPGQLAGPCDCCPLIEVGTGEVGMGNASIAIRQGPCPLVYKLDGRLVIDVEAG